MNVQFVGEPECHGESATVEVRARGGGRAFTVVVTEDALRTLSNELTSPRSVGDLFRRHANLFRDVVADKVLLANNTVPDRMTIVAADLHGRRY